MREHESDSYTLLTTLPGAAGTHLGLRLQMLLGDAGLPKLTTITTTSHRAVDELLGRGGIDLVLLADFDAIDGLEHVRQHVSSHAEVPLVVLADERERSLGWQALEAGAEDCLLSSELTATNLGRAVRFAVERHRKSNAMRRLERYDPLTGLLNTSALLHLLGRLFDRLGNRPDYLFAVFLTELENYGAVGRRYGQLFADEMLVSLARRLERSARPSDVAARLSGQALVLVLPGLDDVREARSVAERIRGDLARPVAVRERTLDAALKWSMATSRGGFEDPHDMLGAAVLDLRCA